nr:lysophosphatidic acid phosphatase type 6 [Hymenolepis microstoma]
MLGKEPGLLDFDFSPTRKGTVQLSKIKLTLVQAQVFFRHGARTPLHLVKSSLAHAEWTPDTTKDIPEVSIAMQHVDIHNRTPVDEASVDLIYKPIKLPGGESIGMLTSVGQKDLFNLGVELRKRYSGEGGIVSDPPKLNEIETRSTRVGRNLKSIRSLVAGLCDNKLDGTLVVPSMNFDVDVLFPNPKLNNDDTAFNEGTEELNNDPDILALKKKICEALKIDRLIDELDRDPETKSRDCQVYYVRDDYAARKHNGFDVPQALNDLEKDMDHYSAVELLSELLGKRAVPPLQLVAVHDSTILPMLLVLDSCSEMWPPFGADITFELYLQSRGPVYRPPNDHKIPIAEPNSNFDWSGNMLEHMWVRVLYLGQPLPLLTKWCDDKFIQELTGSSDFIPLMEFILRMTPIALSLDDYHAKCRKIVEQLKAAKGQSEDHHIHKGPKNM